MRPGGIGSRIRYMILGCVGLTLLVIGLVFIRREHDHLNRMLGERLEAIAATAAAQLSGEMGDLHDELQSDQQVGSLAWARWRDALQSIQTANGMEEDIYTFAPGESDGEWHFIARSYERPEEHEGAFIGEAYRPTDPAQREAFRRALEEGIVTHTPIYGDDLSDRLWITAFAPIRNSQGVIVGVLDVDLDAMAHSAALQMRTVEFLVLAAVLLLLTLIVAHVLSGTITRPIERLAGAAEALGRGDYEHPLPTDAACEIGQLARTFDGMRGRLRDLSQQEQESMRLSTIGRMASGIIHDFKNPMTAISGYAMLMSETSFEIEQRREFAKRIQHNIKTMVDMTQDLLAWSRGESTLDLNPVPTNEFIDDIVTDTQRGLNEAGVMLCLDNTAHDVLLVDAGKLRRVLLNLLTNAREAMKEGGVIDLTSRLEGDAWRLTVHDNGPGIPEEVRDRLFEAFATHGKSNGTGLGLALAKEFVEQHGGSIEVETRSGEGTSFTITIPIREAQREAA